MELKRLEFKLAEKANWPPSINVSIAPIQFLWMGVALADGFNHGGGRGHLALWPVSELATFDALPWWAQVLGWFGKHHWQAGGTGGEPIQWPPIGKYGLTFKINLPVAMVFDR